MHMADALLSPAVGGLMWASTAALTVHCSRHLKRQQSEQMAPMMAVLGAFIFASQMINFAIPGTGSSGHMGGGLLLAILLGPHAAFLTLASVLTVQALFFADGGLLALGSNIFNLGVFPCFIAYPLIYRPLAGDGSNPARRIFASFVTAVAGLSMGALAVVFETRMSGISELPFVTFVLLMLPVHMAIGLVEGGLTAAVVGFIAKARPDILALNPAANGKTIRLRGVAVSLLVVATLTGGVLSWFASDRPDGLEWSIQKITGKDEVEGNESALRRTLASIQTALALMPDYDFKPVTEAAKPEARSGSVVKPGTSLAGLLGAGMTLLIAGGVGLYLRRRHRQAMKSDGCKI